MTASSGIASYAHFHFNFNLLNVTGNKLTQYFKTFNEGIVSRTHGVKLSSDPRLWDDTTVVSLILPQSEASGAAKKLDFSLPSTSCQLLEEKSLWRLSYDDNYTFRYIYILYYM